MSDPRTDLPNPKAANFNQRIRETLMTYLGRQGNPLDRGLTLRDLLENGLVKIRDGFTLKPGQSGTLPLEPIPADGEADLTPPPTPTGFAVSAAITHVFIEHDAPLYRQGHGHLRTRVYGKIVQAGDPLPTFADATEITQFSGTVHAHPSNPATTWHLWIKWESVDGVLSTNPAGGTNGLSTTTGQDVALLLDALAGQITESELYQTLNDRINLIDGPSTLDNSVAQRIAAEATARAAEVASEVAARVSADAAETQARIDAVAAETAARNNQISIESHQRLEQVQSTGEAALNAIIAANNERIDRLTDVASARQELKTDFDAGILAEATARLELTAVVNQNVADILSEQTARSTADSALASSITTLTSQVNDNTAAIQTEAATRANADAAEATQRNLLAAQFRGDYTGNDINQVTSGLLYQERTARAAQDNALAQQITLLSAGAGEQFDWKKIWYFDDGADSWTGNGTPTVNQGWLRPANQASGAYVESPTGIGSDGNKYGQVRLRIRKVGSPTFAGFLWWRAAADTTWDTARRIALTAPTFDANGIGLITVSPAWTVTIDRIRLDLSSAQTATDYFEIDWVAVGRPSPGASSAQLLEEQGARATADAAEATERKTLSSTLIGQENPDGVTLSGLTSGLLFEERQARSTQDTAIATSVTSLQTTVTNNYTTLSSAITDEATARSTADTSEANARKSLSAKLTGFEDPTGKTLADLTSGLVFDEKTARVTADSALSQSITGLNSTVGDLSADLLTVQQTVASLDVASASTVTTLVADSKRNSQNLDELAEATLRDAIAVNNERATRQETLAFAQESLSIKIEEGLLAESQARQLLSATVNENTASILAEQMARATADESISTSLTALIAQTGSDAQAAILAEQTARTAQDSALASSIASLTATVNDNTAAIVAEQTTRAGADNALASSITALTATVEGNLVSTNAAITAEQTARANADSALATQITTLQSTVDTNNTTLTAAVQTEASTRATETGNLFAKYTVKIDVAGHVSGYGLASTANNATPTSQFGVRANQFFVAPPSVSQATAPTTGLYKGYVWVDTSVTPNVTKYYTGSAWGTTPQALPFIVQASPTTINGVDVPAGVYMDDAYIKNGTITNAKIGNAAIDDAKIANLSASKITAGSIAVGQYIQSAGYVAGSSGWRVNGDGNAELSNAVVRGTVYATDGQFVGEVIAQDAGGNKARMWAGDFEIYKQVPNVGQVLYKALSRVESGVGANNVQVTIPGYFLNQPRVIVSPANIKLYDAAYANQSQSVQCEVRDLIESPAGSMVWKFTPLATLSLAANTGQTVINQTSGAISTNWTSSQYTTQANTTKITPSVSLASYRGTGTSGVYFYRTVRWRVEYLSGGSWVAGAWTTTNLGADANASTTTTATFTFPSAGTWTFRVYAEAYDTSTATFGSIAYETATDTISRTGNVTQTIQSYEETSKTLNYTPTYSLPSGWSIVSINYSYVYSYQIIKYGTGNCSIAGDEFYLFSNGSGSNLSASSTNSSNTLTFTLSSNFDAFGQGAYVTMTMHSVTGTVTRRRPAPSSTTPANSFSLNSYSYELTSAQVLATGTLNWVAIGE